ncbi:MAG: serine/threonine protein kinase, partial [Planctomycetaceae bacterium]|nr:serine/threonine protein kinase [Planctomycetaceae bacterium]
MKFAFAPESKPLEGFTIKRAIHRGGFGEVYYALTDAGKEVALKLLHNNLEVELRGVSQCLNLKHPNLVTIFDMRQDSEKDHWIVMEYVGGKSLYDCVHEHPAGMPLNDVLAWLSGMTAGLSFLHDRGIVHRDLKPANVFSDAGVVKIGDVGLSKYISESRRSAQTQSVGTVYYMAPEVARGRYGREVDVYSMGVMLYEMMTGRVPFEGETTAEILMKHLTAEPDLSVLPEKLRPVISAALEKDPDRRINDVEELERRFRTCVAESGFPVEQPAPLLKPRPDKNHSRAAVASTIIGEGPKKPAERGIRSAWNSLVTVWNEQVPTPLKWVISGAVIILLIDLNILRTGPIMSGGIVGGLAYLLYRKFWKKDVAETAEQLRGAEVELSGAAAELGRQVPKGTQSTSPGAQPVMVAAPRHVAPVPQPVPMNPRNYSPATTRQIPKGQRAVDITTSLSVSLAAVALVTAAIHLATEILPNPADVAFFASTILLASWALIVPAKLWEGRTGDPVVRRIVQGALGLGVGAVAAVIQNF